MECSGYRVLEALSGGVSGRDPPVPIPNTEVKPASADGTWGSRPWESRSPPGIFCPVHDGYISGPAPFLVSALLLVSHPRPNLEVIVAPNSSTPPGRRDRDNDRPKRSSGPGGASGPSGRDKRPGQSRGPRRDPDESARSRQEGGGSRGSGSREPDRGRQSRQESRPRTITAVPDGTLPKWVRDEVIRATPKARRDTALRQLEVGIAHYAEERYKRAIDHLGQAKTLAPQSSIIRELLGLSAYYAEQWLPALQELRAFRRFTGETIHMPVEMDSLRAMGRSADVDKTWELFNELGSDRDTQREAAVVYASHLLDKGRIAEAWRVIKPGRLASPAPESEVRKWFVAARVAKAAGDVDSATRLIAAVAREDPALPGLAELQADL